jgi:TatD DNase family protein
MQALPTLDAHGHLSADHPLADLLASGHVIALTLSLQEAERALGRQDPQIVWGVGCYPRRAASQAGFDVGRFRELVEQTPVVGEVGLDTGSRVPIETQLHTFRQVLAVVAEKPRLVSIHSYRATRLVLDELRRTPVVAPILHWWTGSADETSEAVALGCSFSIHSAVARHSKFRTRVPVERLLVESDHGYGDPPAAIPCRVEWVEHLVAQQLKIEVMEARRLFWRNLAALVERTGTASLWPKSFLQNMRAAREPQ